MDLTSQVLCNIVLSSIGLYFDHQSHPQLGIVFDWLLSSFFLELFSPVFSSSILETYEVPGEFIFQCHISLLFILFIGFSRQEFWSGLPFPSPVNDILSDLSIMPSILSGPTCHGSKFHWVRQGCDPCDKAPTIRPIQRDVFPGVFSQSGLECQVSIQRKTAHHFWSRYEVSQYRNMRAEFILYATWLI